MQVLVNLVSNAIKFTDVGSVTVAVEPLNETMLQFTVSDTGIGIAADRQHLLFAPFTQGDGSYTRRHGGTGLGLAICHRLTELMHGEIGIISQPGEGSRFRVTARLVPEEEMNLRQAAQAAS